MLYLPVSMKSDSLTVDDDDGQSIARPEWTKASMITLYMCKSLQ